MTDLDDAAGIRVVDSAGMLAAVAGLPEQVRSGYREGRETTDLPSLDGITSVVFCGMGGSAVSGDVIRSAFRGRLPVPFDVVRGPELPAFASLHTLVVCSSYSGNTAETLACFEEAVSRGARMITITSGGTLAARAAELELARITVPPGFQPRAAIGHLAFGVLGALESAGLVPSLDGDVEEAVRVLEGLVIHLGPDVPTEANLAKRLAARIGGRVPVVWGAEGIGAVAAMRWKTQLNENAKVPAFSSALPELDHNEVVGWSEGAGTAFFIVALRVREENDEVAPRFPLSIRIANDAGAASQEVEAAGRSALAQAFSLVFTGDYVSVYLGLLRGFDPTPVEAIDRLKRALAGR